MIGYEDETLDALADWIENGGLRTTPATKTDLNLPIGGNKYRVIRNIHSHSLGKDADGRKRVLVKLEVDEKGKAINGRPQKKQRQATRTVTRICVNSKAPFTPRTKALVTTNAKFVMRRDLTYSFKHVTGECDELFHTTTKNYLGGKASSTEFQTLVLEAKSKSCNSFSLSNQRFCFRCLTNSIASLFSFV